MNEKLYKALSCLCKLPARQIGALGRDPYGSSNADVWQFGIMTSRMHMAWTRFVGGRLKSDYQYSVGVNFNPFPWPQVDLATKHKLETLAKTVLDARAAHEGAPISTIPMSCRPIYARRIARSTRRSIGRPRKGGP
jgi:hypothetical protein